MHFQHQEQTEQPSSWAPQSTEFDYLCPSSFYWISRNCNIASKQGRLNSRDRLLARKHTSQALKTLTRKRPSNTTPRSLRKLPPLSKAGKSQPESATRKKPLISVEDLCYQGGSEIIDRRVTLDRIEAYLRLAGFRPSVRTPAFRSNDVQ